MYGVELEKWKEQRRVPMRNNVRGVWKCARATRRRKTAKGILAEEVKENQEVWTAGLKVESSPTRSSLCFQKRDENASTQKAAGGDPPSTLMS